MLIKYAKYFLVAVALLIVTIGCNRIPTERSASSTMLDAVVYETNEYLEMRHGVIQGLDFIDHFQGQGTTPIQYYAFDETTEQLKLMKIRTIELAVPGNGATKKLKLDVATYNNIHYLTNTLQFDLDDFGSDLVKLKQPSHFVIELDSAIYELDLNANKLTLLVGEGRQPLVSPNDSYMLFQKTDSSPWIYSFETGEASPINLDEMCELSRWYDDNHAFCVKEKVFLYDVVAQKIMKFELPNVDFRVFGTTQSAHWFDELYTDDINGRLRNSKGKRIDNKLYYINPKDLKVDKISIVSHGHVYLGLGIENPSTTKLLANYSRNGNKNYSEKIIIQNADPLEISILTPKPDKKYSPEDYSGWINDNYLIYHEFNQDGSLFKSYIIDVRKLPIQK